MNKTIIININGIVFHIEEDAYEVLRRYMTEVKRHFVYTADSEEIVSDIENRIAEMFVERLEQEKKQVIVLQDVQQVTAQMGAVNDFDLEGESAAFIPDNPRIGKKLFRDTDDRIIGGVCSGLGHYFDIEPRWVRLIAIFFVLLGGSGFLIYVILWIVTPKAKTRTDKMAMKGEQPNLQNFKKNFDEEAEALRHNVSRVHTEAQPEDSLRDFFAGLISFIGILLKGIIKLIGVFIIFIGGMALLGMFIGLFAMLGWNSKEFTFIPFNVINSEYRSALYFSAFLIIIIPIASLVLFAIRVFFHHSIITKTGAFFMLILWISGLCMATYYGTKIGSEFKEEASFSEEVDLKAFPTYYLKLSDTEVLSYKDSIKLDRELDNLSSHNAKNRKIHISAGRVQLSSRFIGINRRIIIQGNGDNFDDFRMELSIEESDIDRPLLVKVFSSHGRDFETGLLSAQQINYQFSQVDSVLVFPKKISLGRDELWRNQRIKLVLRIPRNTRLIIDNEMAEYLRDIDLWHCHPDGTSQQIPTPFKMTSEGLKCDTLQFR